MFFQAAENGISLRIILNNANPPVVAAQEAGQGFFTGIKVIGYQHSVRNWNGHELRTASSAALPARNAFLQGVEYRASLRMNLLEDTLQSLPVLTGELFTPSAGVSLMGLSFYLPYAGRICRVGRHIIASIPTISPREK